MAASPASQGARRPGVGVGTAPTGVPSQITVGSNSNAWDGNLFGIAQHVYGNGNAWRTIYLANKAVIGHPNTPLRPGTTLTIPPRP